MAETVFFPSTVVNLQLRFEEKLQIRANQTDGSFQTEQLASDQGAGTFVLNRVPKKCSVHFQGHTQAATWNMIFDYRELPIDPRTVAAATVHIHMGTVSADDFSAGMQRELRPGVRRSILQTRNASGALIEDNLVMIGPVDKWKVTHEEGGAEVHLEGRDLRGLLLDSPLVSAQDSFDYSSARPVRRPRNRRSSILKRLNTERDIVTLVQQILDEHDVLRTLPESQRIRAIGFRDEWPDQTILSPGAGSHIPRHRRGANGQQGQSGAAHSNLNFWDIISRYCQPGDALVRRDDLSWVPISEIKVGDKLLGYAKDQDTKAQRKYHKYAAAEVQEVFVRKALVVALHMESGRVVRCTPDHHWYTGRCEPGYEFAMPSVGRELVRVFDAPAGSQEVPKEYKLGYVRGLIDGDAAVCDRIYFDEHGKRKSRTKGIFLAMNDIGSLARYKSYLTDLGIRYTEGISRSGPGLTYTQPVVRACTQKALDTLVLAPEPVESKHYLRGWLAGIFDAEGSTSSGVTIAQYRKVNPDTWTKIRDRLQHFGFATGCYEEAIRLLGGIKESLRFFDLVQPAAVFKFRKYVLGARMTGTKDRILRIEEIGEQDVYSLRTSTGTYIGQGYASRNCNLVGAIPTFVGRELHIRYAPTLYSMIAGKNERIPFQGGRSRIMEVGPERTVRALVYGRDVESMSLERAYSGNHKPKTVRVISVDSSSGRRGRHQLMESTWPPRNIREARREGVHGNNQAVRDFVGGEESGEVMNIPVPGVRSQAQLDAIARSYYEQIGRNEMKGEVSTGALTSFGGSNADPDLLRVRVGDPLELLVDASRLDASSPIVSTLTRTAQLPFAEAVQEVQQLLHGDRNLARAIVASARGNIMGVLRYYRICGLDLEWSGDSVNVKIDLQNYWTPRYDFEARDMIQTRRTQHPNDHDRGANASRVSQTATQPNRTPSTSGSTRTPATRGVDPNLSLSSIQRGESSGTMISRDLTGLSTPDFLNNPGGSRWQGRRR